MSVRCRARKTRKQRLTAEPKHAGALVGLGRLLATNVACGGEQVEGIGGRRVFLPWIGRDKEKSLRWRRRQCAADRHSEQPKSFTPDVEIRHFSVGSRYRLSPVAVP